ERAFTVRAVDRHAGNALQRLGEVGVGELAHFLGRDGIDDALGVALDILRLTQRGTDAGDDDVVAGYAGRRVGARRVGSGRPLLFGSLDLVDRGRCSILRLRQSRSEGDTRAADN